MERALTRGAFDFVQLTYNFADRRIEERCCRSRRARLAVVVNRPFDCGALFRAVAAARCRRTPREIDCANWAQFFLKYTSRTRR